MVKLNGKDRQFSYPSDPTYAQPAPLSIFEPEWHISYSR